MATTTTPAALISNPQKTTLFASGGVTMAVATATGGFMRPQRLLAVPARVLQAVVVAVPATAAPWSSSGRRGVAMPMRLHAAASGPSSGGGDTPAEEGFGFYKIVEIRVSVFLKYLLKMLRSPPPGLTAKYGHVETLTEAVNMARAQEDYSDKLKFEIVLPMVRASYSFLELAYDLYASPTDDPVPPILLPGEQDFIAICLAHKDHRKDVMTPAMQSLLDLAETKEMPRIIPEPPETDLRFVETIFFATEVSMTTAEALHDRATTTYYSSRDGVTR